MPELLTRPGFWLAAYLAVMNLAAFGAYGADKRRARRGSWRIPERTLFLLPLLGGSVGALQGMHVFRHKTRYFPSPTGCLRRRMVPEQVIYPFFSRRAL